MYVRVSVCVRVVKSKDGVENGAFAGNSFVGFVVCAAGNKKKQLTPMHNSEFLFSLVCVHSVCFFLFSLLSSVWDLWCSEFSSTAFARRFLPHRFK